RALPRQTWRLAVPSRRYHETKPTNRNQLPDAGCTQRSGRRQRGDDVPSTNRPDQSQGRLRQRTANTLSDRFTLFAWVIASHHVVRALADTSQQRLTIIVEAASRLADDLITVAVEFPSIDIVADRLPELEISRNHPVDHVSDRL